MILKEFTRPHLILKLQKSFLFKVHTYLTGHIKTISDHKGDYVVLLGTEYSGLFNSFPLFHIIFSSTNHHEKLANARFLIASELCQFCMSEKALKSEGQGRLFNLPEEKPCCPFAFLEW